MKKRPDFACMLKDLQAKNFKSSQITYFVECKRLGIPENKLVFNSLYSEKGIARFISVEHQYAKNCPSASMIGYIQNMEPDNILTEVNKFAKVRSVLSLTKAAAAWATDVTRVSQLPLSRHFDTTKIQLTHFWVDLRKCKFDRSSSDPPQLDLV